MQENKDSVRASDRFMPCVLSRLTDQNPQLKTEHFAKGISIKQLKNDILKNIELVLNSRSHPSDEELNCDPEIINSVLGMGLSDFCGISHSSFSENKLRKEIIRQLSTFETRLVPETLSVHFVSLKTSNTAILDLEISGQINAEPLREEILFFSRLNLEDGNVQIKLLNEQ